MSSNSNFDEVRVTKQFGKKKEISEIFYMKYLADCMG